MAIRRMVIGATAAAAIALTGAAGCSGDENSASKGAKSAQSGEQKPGTAGGPANAQQAQQQIDSLLQKNPVVFTSTSPELTDQNRQTLQKIAGMLKSSGAKITIVTHAGYKDPQRAQELSKQRADAISQALQQEGVPAQQITANATGNTTAQGEQALQTQFKVSQ
ncbi:MAG: OmpA family protein [Pseudonocardiaceae bacterium]|nr:OmpA family protein [Pseudonocardiaceae bacterium]